MVAGKRVIGRAAGCFVALVCSALLPSMARAQLGGTIWLDYNGGTSPLATSAMNPQGAFNVATLQGYTGQAGATAANLTTVENDITQDIQNAYAGFSFNITATQPMGGTYTTVMIGTVPTAAGASPSLLGRADEIDWRNLDFNNTVGININPAILNANDAGYPNVNYAFNSFGVGDPLALSIANTTLHEIGHAVGLEHLDMVNTYQAAIAGGSTVAQAMTTVQTTDAMGYNNNYQNETNVLSFNPWEKIKLTVATQGILLENEAATTAMGYPGVTAANDPVTRAGDAGNTVATGTPLKFQNNMVNVLGTLSASTDLDDFSFSGYAGETVSAEVLSSALAFPTGISGGSQLTGPRIAGGPNPIGTAILNLVQAVNAAPDNTLQSSPYPVVGATGGRFAGSTDYDGFINSMGNNRNTVSTGGGLIYNFSLPAAGNYAFQVGGSSAGNYELFVVVPEPTTLALLLGAPLLLMRRRRRAA